MFLTVCAPRYGIRQGKFVLDLVIDRARDTEPTTISQALQACSDIHPVPINPLTLDDDITHVDANTIFHLAVIRKRSISDAEFALNRNGAPHGIHRTGKLR